MVEIGCGGLPWISWYCCFLFKRAVMLVPDDPKGSRDAIDDDGNSMSGSEVAQRLKKKTQRRKERRTEQTRDREKKGGVGVCDGRADG